MSAVVPSDFLTAFEARRDQCRALLELSRQQQALIGSDDYTGLLVVLGQKQLILGRLDDMKARHAEVYAQWTLCRNALDTDARHDCEHVLAETEALLAELIREEDSSTQHIVRRRDVAHHELQAVSHAGQVNRAYRDALAPATHRHLDVNQ
jgi:hypothetical protein